MNLRFTVFTMPNCPDCKNAKALLERKGLDFSEKVDFTPQELLNLVGPVRTLPQIVVEESSETFHIGGYKDLSSFLSLDPLNLATLRKIS